MKGVHQKRATGWRTLSPTPAGAVKRGARRHPLSEKKRAVARPSPSYFIRHNAPPCLLSTQVR
ncbi:arginase [Escherichia coli]|uniref:arginase n=1 Tax=Escherichia coli TaxID=562 RepID=UPI0039C88CF7